MVSSPSARRIISLRADSTEARFRTLFEPAQIVRQRMQLIHVIGRRIAREPGEEKSALPDLAQLLRAHGAPFDDGAPFQSELIEQPIGGFGRACERAGEDFRMSD